MIQPPSVGPRVGPTMTPTPKIAVAAPRSSNGKTSKRIAWAVEMSAPPPIPCRTREPTRVSRVWALPQKKDAVVKRMIEPV